MTNQIESSQPNPSAEAMTPFSYLVHFVAMNAAAMLGAFAPPNAQTVEVDLDGASQMIDCLLALEEKTKGNLTDAEQSELREVISQLQLMYVQVSGVIRRPSRETQPQAAASAASTEAGTTSETPSKTPPEEEKQPRFRKTYG